MNQAVSSTRLFSILSGVSGVVGVALLAFSFGIAIGPPAGAGYAEMLNFG
jgi:hypothetical protein